MFILTLVMSEEIQKKYLNFIEEYEKTGFVFKDKRGLFGFQSIPVKTNKEFIGGVLFEQESEPEFH